MSTMYVLVRRYSSLSQAVYHPRAPHLEYSAGSSSIRAEQARSLVFHSSFFFTPLIRWGGVLSW